MTLSWGDGTKRLHRFGSRHHKCRERREDSPNWERKWENVRAMLVRKKKNVSSQNSISLTKKGDRGANRRRPRNGLSKAC